MAVKVPWLGPGGPIFALASWMQGDMHMVAARHGCQSAMVGTRWAILALAAWTGLENTTLTL